MAAHKVIGEINCRCSKLAAVVEQKNGFAMYACRFCGLMEQTSSRPADRDLRGRMTPLSGAAADDMAAKEGETSRPPPGEKPEAEEGAAGVKTPVKKKKNMWGI